MSKNMIYDANEATNLTNNVTGITIAEGKSIKFGMVHLMQELLKTL